jgi:ribonucleoside-diphosphate reductase alpha chain
MMDCDTTGIEPDIARVKYKKLVGGGTLKIVNTAVPQALIHLGYSSAEIAEITQFIDQHDTIEGAPGLKAEHLAVFDCAFKPFNGTRSIHYQGHIKMMAACQPFLSGAISKTVNLPEEATVEDIATTYLEAWKLGIKAVAIYRDNCKRSQPMNTKKTSDVKETPVLQAVERIVEVEKIVERPLRKKLPDERQALTHKFSIAGHEGYVTVGLHEDGTPGEVFITMAKEGSTLSGLLDAFATSISLALQYGVPLDVLCNKFTATRYEPSGFTGNKEIPIAKSITDYIFRWLSLKFLSGTNPLQARTAAGARLEGTAEVTGTNQPAYTAAAEPESSGSRTAYLNQADAPPCHSCGEIMVRNGACYKCSNCGSTSGCS